MFYVFNLILPCILINGIGEWRVSLFVFAGILLVTLSFYILIIHTNQLRNNYRIRIIFFFFFCSKFCDESSLVVAMNISHGEFGGILGWF